MYSRSPYVHAIITRLKKQSGLRGIVSNEEVHSVCDKIRELLKDRDNVMHEQDWQALLRFAWLNRRFTVAEAERVYTLYSQYKYPRIKLNNQKK